LFVFEIADGDGVDLDLRLGEFGYAEDGAGRRSFLEIGGEGLVEGGVVVDVFEVHLEVDEVVEVEVGGFEDGFDVVEGLADLGGEICWSGAGGSVRALGGDIEVAIGFDGRGGLTGSWVDGLDLSPGGEEEEEEQEG
jgi:hypothetical protein